MTPTTAAIRTALVMWQMARYQNRRVIWEWMQDRLYGAALYALAKGEFADEDYFDELAIAASEIAAECR